MSSWSQHARCGCLSAAVCGEVAADDVDVVQHGDDGASLFVPGLNNRQQQARRGRIDGGEWFVQQDQSARPARWCGRTARAGTGRRKVPGSDAMRLCQADTIQCSSGRGQAVLADERNGPNRDAARATTSRTGDGKRAVEVAALCQQRDVGRRRPPRLIRPCSSGCKPAMARNRVVLPDPFSPIRAVRLPEAIVPDKADTTIRVPCRNSTLSKMIIAPRSPLPTPKPAKSRPGKGGRWRRLSVTMGRS